MRFGETPSGQARVGRLVALLSSVESRLREGGDEHWAEWLSRDRARIAHGDAYGLDHLTQAYGGMGSINDTYPRGDGDIGDALGEIYQLAAQLLADHRAGDG